MNSVWRTFEEISSLLPRTIPDWYKFKCREYWEEDGAFETRFRRAGRRGRSQNRNTSKPVFPSVLIIWHDVGGFSIRAEERSNFFMELPLFVERMAVSPLLSASSSILQAQN